MSRPLPRRSRGARWDLVTVTPSPALDLILELDRLTPREAHRPRHSHAVAGGKGLNAARVAAQLGGAAAAAGFLAGWTGDRVRSLVRADGVDPEFLDVPGETRTAVILVEPGTDQPTQVIGPPPPVDERAADALVERLGALARGAPWVLLAGSLPPGASPNLHARLIAAARAAGARVLLDTYGPPLSRALPAGPDVVKCNQAELEGLVQAPLPDHRALLAAARQVRARTGGAVVVSAGGAGAVAVCAEGAWVVPPLPVHAVNTVGCGDAMAAGLALALSRGLPFGRALRVAVAAGAANAVQVRTGWVNPADVWRLEPQVRLQDTEG